MISLHAPENTGDVMVSQETIISQIPTQGDASEEEFYDFIARDDFMAHRERHMMKRPIMILPSLSGVRNVSWLQSEGTQAGSFNRRRR